MSKPDLGTTLLNMELPLMNIGGALSALDIIAESGASPAGAREALMFLVRSMSRAHAEIHAQWSTAAEIARLQSKHGDKPQEQGASDINLLMAFEQWRAAAQTAEFSAVSDPSDEGVKEAELAAANAGRRVEDLPVTTLRGAIAKLRYLFAKYGELNEHYEAVLFGALPNEQALADYRHKMHWDLICDLERMAKGGAA
ncbi:hypothetical protein [Azospirillum argentinense]|uniref:hypothetical protein n=1 Tax=Azospirillum argentinense TaxID=2970906 RepID=UPI0032DEBBFD